MGNGRCRPNRLIEVSILPTSTRTDGLSLIRRKAPRFSETVTSSATPPRRYSNAATLRHCCALPSKSSRVSRAGIAHRISSLEFATEQTAPKRLGAGHLKWRRSQRRYVRAAPLKTPLPHGQGSVPWSSSSLLVARRAMRYSLGLGSRERIGSGTACLRARLGKH